MSHIAIHVESLRKRYRIGERERYFALRDVVARIVSAPFRRSKPSASDALWALRDVSFDVKSGEVVGLIGRNGAGKTTLLKILSRITQPTSGFADLRGRVGSLLEVGTGFHPELTGRENIYLSGAIRGNNLTGGHLVEQWYALPTLVVDTPPLAHPQDRWADFFNIPAEIEVESPSRIV